MEFSNTYKTDTGLVVSPLEAAEPELETGRRPNEDDVIYCHYKGLLTDGQVFENTLDNGAQAIALDLKEESLPIGLRDSLLSRV